MKYLKGYKIFENVDDNLLSRVEEAFYNISDRYYVSIDELNSGYEIKDDRIMITISYNELETLLMDYSIIKDDLEFALSYLINELKLNFLYIYIYTLLDARNGKPNFFKSFEDLTHYNNLDGSIIKRIHVYFDNPNKV